MSIKPVLVPDQDAKTLRELLETFDAAATGTARKQLNEMDYGGGRSPHGGHGLPRDDDDDAGKKEIMVKPETAKKATKNASDALNKAFDASYDKKGVAEISLTEFAPSQPGGDDDGNDDGFDEETLRRMAAHWLEGDEDPRIEQLLAAAGWEIGQDEGYDDEPGVFVVMSGDEHGKSYISWPAAELRSAMSEGTMSRAAKGYEKYGREGMTALAAAGREGKDLDPIRAKYDRYDEGAESENLAIGEKMARDGIEYDPAREGEIISQIGDYLRRDGMTTRQVRGYMIDPDFISDQLSYLPRKSGVAEGAEKNPVVNAITRRIMLQRTDLLSKYGPEKIGQAVDEVADFVGDVEEIGSSDVSGWVRHVEQMLGNMESDIAEASPPGGFKQGDRVTVQGQKGPTGSTTGVFVQQIPTTTGQKPMYAFRFDDKKYTGNTYDMVSANNIFPATVAESIDPIEQLRADIQRFAR